MNETVKLPEAKKEEFIGFINQTFENIRADGLKSYRLIAENFSGDLLNAIVQSAQDGFYRYYDVSGFEDPYLNIMDCRKKVGILVVNLLTNEDLQKEYLEKGWRSSSDDTDRLTSEEVVILLYCACYGIEELSK